MKILLVQDYLRSGGTERQSILLARAFSAAGHTAELLTFRPGGALAQTAGPVRIHQLQPVDLKMDWLAPGLAKTVRRIAPDVVLCMGRMANSWAGRIRSALRRPGLPAAAVISTMRTGKPLPFLFRRSLRRVDHVVANSEDARRVLVERYRVPLAKTTVIRNSLVFSPDETAPLPSLISRDQLRREKGAGEKTCVLLSVGMFRPEKNQRALIELAAQLPGATDFQLWLVGEGGERARCEALVEAKGLGRRIKFLGFVADPRPVYRAADVAVLASRSESLSNFLIEAHAHGLPSVAYDVMGVRECGGMAVATGNEKAFAEALLPLVLDEARRAAEGGRVREFARLNFSPAAQAAEYLQLFGELLRNS
jgi:glycosyltransferase involved in cell wall biosynthesis